MAFYSKADFAKLCGLTTGNLTNYIKRGKVVMSGDYIDDSMLQNREFLRKRKENLVAADNEEEPRAKMRMLRPDPGMPEPPNIKEPEDIDDDDAGIDINIDDESSYKGEAAAMYKLNKKKLVVAIQKTKEEIALLKLRNEKLNAVVIPTELVKVVLLQQSRSMATEFKNTIDSIITNISKKKDLTLTEVAQLRGELLHCINSAVDKSLTESKKNIANIVKEFVERKEVGERG